MSASLIELVCKAPPNGFLLHSFLFFFFIFLATARQEIDEDSKLVEGLRKIRSIAKATRTLVNIPSMDRSEQVRSGRFALSWCVCVSSLSHFRWFSVFFSVFQSKGRIPPVVIQDASTPTKNGGGSVVGVDEKPSITNMNAMVFLKIPQKNIF